METAPVAQPNWRETAVKRIQLLSYRIPAWALIGGAILLLVVLFFYKIIFSNLIFARGDTFLYFYPYWEAASSALQNGRLPLWNPHLFMGAPLLANSQVGFFYPLNWPFWLLLEPPYAVKASLVLHVLIAAFGAYRAAEQTMQLDRSGALLTAVLFALGGYFTAQLEHVNQMQGLAWMPWYLVLLTYAADDKVSTSFVVVAKTAVGLALLFALQLLAGHTQTAFISGVMVVLWGIGKGVNYYLNRNHENMLLFHYPFMRFRVRAPLALGVGVGLALLLAAIQLVPTYELTQLSSRQGGLSINEALSFSLHPLLLTRALLPAYNQSLFTEYVAFLPGSAIVLATIAAWQWRSWRGVFPALLLVVAGLLLGLGQFNPLNWVIMRLPGFSLFRVPARWLALYGLGMALLAGLGWQIVLDRYSLRTLEWRSVPERARETLWSIERPLRIGIYILIGLILWSSVATILALFIPTPPEAPYESPSRLTLLLWLVELVIVFFWLSGQRIRYDSATRFKLVVMPGRLRHPWLIGVMMVGLLFWGTRTHPYHLNLTTPEAYFDVRSATARLQTAVSCQPAPTCNEMAGRVLSLSHIQFDPGDMGELRSIYADQLSPTAWDEYVVAIKQKEIVGPNLAISFGLFTVDGFDGGILPLASYSDLVNQMLPEDAVTTDGRLREQLTAVPDPRWLDLFNVRYLITDKTGDQWLDVTADHNAFFDMQHPVTIADGTLEIAYLPPFAATHLVLVADDLPSRLELTVNGETVMLEPTQTESGLWQFGWQDAQVVEQAILHIDAPATIEAAVLFNEADGTFQSLVLGNYRLIHSGDVKIYENLDVMARAAVGQMGADGWFVVDETAVLTTQTYDFNRVDLRVESDGGTLLFAESHYPGWQATVDGELVEIEPLYGLFRSIELPAGTHDVSFTFESQSLIYGRFATIFGLVIITILLATFAALSLSNRR